MEIEATIVAFFNFSHVLSRIWSTLVNVYIILLFLHYVIIFISPNDLVPPNEDRTHNYRVLIFLSKEHLCSGTNKLINYKKNIIFVPAKGLAS